MITIENYIRSIFEDFRAYTASSPNLCDLAELRFDGNQNPDYTKEYIQQLYLLRYAYGYAYEYRWMYSKLFKQCINNDVLLPLNLKVLSLGCGAMTDYWALRQALNSSFSIDYIGVDMVEWGKKYLMPACEQDTVSFCQGNMADCLNVFASAKRTAPDVIFFPKSLSELSPAALRELCAAIEKMWLGNCVYLMISMPPCFEGNLDGDDNTVNELLQAFAALGFTLDTRVYDKWPNSAQDIQQKCKPISSKYQDMTYPQNINIFLGNLAEQCKNREFCGYIDSVKEKACYDQLNHWPITTRKRAHFYYFRLVRCSP